MRIFKSQIPIIGLISFFLLFTSCRESKPKDNHGEIIGQTFNNSDSLVFVLLHPNTVLDTIRIVNGRFHYRFPSLNYSRVKMTKADSTFQKGWCKNREFRIIKMELLKKNRRKYSVYFLNTYFNQPLDSNIGVQYFDAAILDNHIIKITIAKEIRPKYFIKAKIEGSVETDKLFKSDYDFFHKRMEKKKH